jgi:hypothetical protein
MSRTIRWSQHEIKVARWTKSALSCHLACTPMADVCAPCRPGMRSASIAPQDPPWREANHMHLKSTAQGTALPGTTTMAVLAACAAAPPAPIELGQPPTRSDHTASTTERCRGGAGSFNRVFGCSTTPVDCRIEKNVLPKKPFISYYRSDDCGRNGMQEKGTITKIAADSWEFDDAVCIDMVMRAGVRKVGDGQWQGSGHRCGGVVGPEHVERRGA